MIDFGELNDLVEFKRDGGSNDPSLEHRQS